MRGTVELDAAARAATFDALPLELQREAWASLRDEVEERERGERSEVVAK